MSRARSPAVCLGKRKLIRAFERAVSEYNRMNTAQVAAVVNGVSFQFTEQIAKAGIRKDRAKYAVLKHEQGHGC